MKKAWIIVSGGFDAYIGYAVIYALYPINIVLAYLAALAFAQLVILKLVRIFE